LVAVAGLGRVTIRELEVMRINVYQEELTDRIELVSKEVEGRKLCGLRFYLKSHPDMHPPPDDDSSAVTFWHADPVILAGLFDTAFDILFMEAN
jgi:hypothetical protein